MIRATLLIRTGVPSRGETPSSLKRILDEIKSINGVTDAFVMYGRFDFVVQLKVDSFEEVVRKAALISRIKQVNSTETLIEAKTEILDGLD
ncbi:MAG: Lrp/AsnC ligand binding domain-containing protein [Candidatus Ranarchaeia archaeon]